MSCPLEDNGLVNRLKIARKSDLASVFVINRELVQFDSVPAIVTFCLQHVEDFNAVNVATALHRLAKLSGNYSPDYQYQKAIRSLQSRALSTTKTFKPQEVANIMWALATIHGPLLH